MKKLLVINLLALIFLSGISPVFAQNSRKTKTSVEVLANPVTYQTAQAFSEGRGTWIQWTTETETKNLGFYVHRVNGGTRETISPFVSGAFLMAREGKITNGSYSFFDQTGDTNSTYVIESVNCDGRRYDSALIQTKATADLKAVAGTSADEFFNQARNADPIATKSESILPADLAADVEANRPAADPVRQRWIAAQPGVKIGVKKEGFYRVSRQALQDAGFDVDTSRSLWQLYLNGVEQAINVSDDGDYIEFYGKGLERYETDTQIYFLIVGETEGKRIGTTIRRRIGSSVVSESYAQTFSKRERVSYSSGYLNGDEDNFYGTVITTGGGTVNFNLTGVDPNAAAATIELTVFGLTLLPHQVKVLLNNVEIGTMSGNLQEVMTKSFTVPASLLQEGANSLRMISQAGGSDYNAFHSLQIGFARRYRAEQNQLSFHVPNYRTVSATNFTSPNIRVFDTTYPDSISLITNLNVEQTGGTYRVNLPSSRGRVLFAVENSAIMQPAMLKENIPSTLSSVARNGNMVIIAHKDFMTQAETWAAYRRNQGMTVEVVNIEDVFDEFGFGVFGADSIRNFLRYAKENWQTPPSYVLLIGDATYDPRNHQGGPNRNFLPTRLVDTIYMETGSDDTLADFNDDGLAEIAIGRVPANAQAQVTIVFNKMMQFEQTAAQGLNRGAVFASDLPDGYDFEALSGRLRDELPNTISRTMINRAESNANTLLVGEMNSGRYLVNYSGHGSITTWASGSFFANSHAVALNNGNNLSMFTMLTCLNGYFVYYDDSIAEALLNNPNGGAVISWASSGLTTPDIQEVMAVRFYGQITAGNITRIGDLIKDAKTTINFGRDVRLSWVLLGDPAMKVR